MYKIIYIDEHQDDIDDFLDYFEEKDESENFKIIPIFPNESLEDTIEMIFGNHPDAIISDYMLNEYKTNINYNVPYTGVNLVEKILEIRAKFPCFVMTSYDDQAIKTSSDVNLVYIKDILHGSESKTNAKASFVDTVKNQIIHYQKMLVDTEKELYRLVEKSKTEPLSGQEHEHLLSFEAIIENATNKKCKIPDNLKNPNELKALHGLIEKASKLIDDLNANKEE